MTIPETNMESERRRAREHEKSAKSINRSKAHVERVQGARTMERKPSMTSSVQSSASAQSAPPSIISASGGAVQSRSREASASKTRETRDERFDRNWGKRSDKW
uniref:Uncharacterized protein n=1 Tax=Florenciella parvula TaxID=236787 RepID=A0A7S2C9A2_9STRA|mmetsp:Transcript_26066/g.53759  ORF Transcript_26066/g.53759 Transcript_26066/m.53759 type:complete len:104 (+) Transcript_26066:3-314(+)